MTELRKCPFCGGKVTVINLYGTIYFGERRWCVVCRDCGLFFTYGLSEIAEHIALATHHLNFAINKLIAYQCFNGQESDAQ